MIPAWMSCMTNIFMRYSVCVVLLCFFSDVYSKSAFILVPVIYYIFWNCWIICVIILVSWSDSDGRCDSCSVHDWNEWRNNEQNLRILVNICNIGGFICFVWMLQEALLSVLCQVLTGKSFELILAVAAVEGKLRTFVTKLLKFNECSKQIGGEGGKASQTRAMLFDVTFLMLCSIVHTYGPEVSWFPSSCFA